jgi:hypothetical protein
MCNVTCMISLLSHFYNMYLVEWPNIINHLFLAFYMTHFNDMYLVEWPKIINHLC